MNAIVRRIEDASTDALIDGKVVVEVRLGKKEFEQYRDYMESIPTKIKLEGKPIKTSYAQWSENGAISIKPTPASSEFTVIYKGVE